MEKTLDLKDIILEVVREKAASFIKENCNTNTDFYIKIEDGFTTIGNDIKELLLSVNKERKHGECKVKLVVR